MNEKWIQRSNMVSDGLGLAYYGRTVRDARGFFELLISAQVGMNALTRERDEAVKRLEVLYARSETPGFIDQLLAERDEAVRAAKVWKAHHDHQVEAKRDGHEKQKAHYEALLAEAVRERDAARALAEKVGRRYCMASLQIGVSRSWKKALAPLMDDAPDPETTYLGVDRWDCKHEFCIEVRHSLTTDKAAQEAGEG